MRTDKTSSKIIDATIKLLNEKGFNGTTTLEIANKAKISEVTLFRKFKNKHNLINESRKVSLNRLFDSIDEMLNIDENLDLRDYIKKLWYNSQEVFDREFDFIKLGLEEVYVDSVKEKIMSQFSEKILIKLTNVFEKKIKNNEIRDINPSVAALTIFGVLFESLIFLKVYGFSLKPYGEEVYLEDFLDIFLNGIGKME